MNIKNQGLTRDSPSALSRKKTHQLADPSMVTYDLEVNLSFCMLDIYIGTSTENIDHFYLAVLEFPKSNHSL